MAMAAGINQCVAMYSNIQCGINGNDKPVANRRKPANVASQ